ASRNYDMQPGTQLLAAALVAALVAAPAPSPASGRSSKAAKNAHTATNGDRSPGAVTARPRSSLRRPAGLKAPAAVRPGEASGPMKALEGRAAQLMKSATRLRAPL